MTVSSDTLALLVNAGLGGEALIAVVRSIENDNPAAPERQVGGSALRMRRLRERRAAEADDVTEPVTSDVTCDATGDVQGDAAPAPALSPNEILNPNPTPTRESNHPRVEPDPVSAWAKFEAAQLAVAMILAGAEDIRRRRWRGMPPPPAVSDDQWRGFIEMRKSIRKTLTDRAYVLLCNRLAEHSDPEWPPGRIVDHMTENSWRSFQPEWLPKDGRNGKRSRNDRPSGWAAQPGFAGLEPASLDD